MTKCPHGLHRSGLWLSSCCSVRAGAPRRPRTPRPRGPNDRPALCSPPPTRRCPHDEAWPLPLVDRCDPDKNGNATSCSSGFVVADIPYAISCAKVLEDRVTPIVLATGALRSMNTPFAEVHLIDSVDATTMVAVRMPSIPCTDADPFGIETWHMAFPDDAHLRVPQALQTALCSVVDSTPAQAQANGWVGAGCRPAAVECSWSVRVHGSAR